MAVSGLFMVERLIALLKNNAVVGVPEGASARIFVVCNECKKVVPSWRVVGTPIPGQQGCKCGSVKFRPSILPNYQAAWWVLVRGIALRKWRGYRQWDPRVPYRDFRQVGRASIAPEVA